MRMRRQDGFTLVELLVTLVVLAALLAIVFDAVFHLTEEGWRKLTLRWAAFFFALAVGNEIARHMLTTDWWAWSKLIVFTPLTFVFAALQYPLIMKYSSQDPNPEAEAEREEV